MVRGLIQVLSSARIASPQAPPSARKRAAEAGNATVGDAEMHFTGAWRIQNCTGILGSADTQPDCSPCVVVRKVGSRSLQPAAPLLYAARLRTHKWHGAWPTPGATHFLAR